MEEFKKYFNDNEYSTKLLGSENDTPPEDINEEIVDSLVALLTLPENKEYKEETLLTLKKERAGDLLIIAIEKATTLKHMLIAAGWESEINFSNHLPFFIQLACDDDYLVSLEAITVIGTMEPPFNENQLKEGIIKVKAKKQTLQTEKMVLLNDLINTLEGFLL